MPNTERLETQVQRKIHYVGLWSIYHSLIAYCSFVVQSFSLISNSFRLKLWYPLNEVQDKALQIAQIENVVATTNPSIYTTTAAWTEPGMVEPARKGCTSSYACPLLTQLSDPLDSR